MIHILESLISNSEASKKNEEFLQNKNNDDLRIESDIDIFEKTESF